jgi:Ca-activated chloride channel homolog
MRLPPFLCVCLLLAAPLFPSAVVKNRKANKEYKKGQYDPAVSLYRDAEVEDPEEKAFSYNLANALYRKGDYETAAKSYERAFSSKDKGLKAKAYFNAGNNYYREAAKSQDQGGQEKLNDAVKMYKEVLKIDPSDQSAKFNLQKTLEKLEQLKQQQQDKKQDEQDKKQDKKNQDEQDKNKQGQDKKDQKDQQKQEQDKKKEEEQKQKDQQADKDKKDDKKPQQQAGKPGQMSPEEAKQLLEAVKQDEKDLQKKRLERMMGSRKLDKDW